MKQSLKSAITIRKANIAKELELLLSQAYALLEVSLIYALLALSGICEDQAISGRACSMDQPGSIPRAASISSMT